MDEEAVSAVEETLANWINPFEDSSDLVSVSTGTTAPADVASDMKEAYEKGERAYVALKKERLESTPPSKKFYDLMKKCSLKTFGTVLKKKQTKCNDGRTMILKADRALFGRMVVMGQSRHIDMKELLRYPLGPLPWSLATPDGRLWKTNKSSLAKSIHELLFPG